MTRTKEYLQTELSADTSDIERSEQERRVCPETARTLGEFTTAGVAFIVFAEEVFQPLADNGEYVPESRPAKTITIPNYPA